MRCRPWRWIWGLIPVIVMGWAAVQIEHKRIQRDLAARGTEALSRDGLGWAHVAFSGRDATLSGKAAEEGEPAKALQVVSSTWGVRSISNHAGLIDEVDRYEWSAKRRDNRVRLSGLVPNERTRRDVVGIVKASFPTLVIDDRLKLARGAPPVDTWLGGVGFGIKQLAQLKSGRVELAVTDLVVTGEATDVAAYRSIKAALKSALPPGISLKGDRVRPPVVKPHLWSVRREEDRLTLKGFVPSEAARAEILTAARHAGADLGAGSMQVLDEMQPGGGEADGWRPAVAAAVQALGQLDEGSVEVIDAAIELTGIAASEAKGKTARDRLRQGAGSAFKVTANVSVRPPPLPTISPYATAAEIKDGVLALSGHAPTRDEQQELVSFAQQRANGLQVRDDLALGAGQPAAWRKCMDVALLALTQLGGGRARLVDRTLTLDARTRSEALQRSLPGSMRSAAGEDCDVQANVALEPKPEPRLTWSADWDKGEIVFSGQVAGDEARRRLTQSAERLFADARVVDRMTVAADASDNWLQAAQEGLMLLARLRRGTVRLVNQELTISGEAREDSVHDGIRDAMGWAMPAGYRARERVSVKPDAIVAPQPQPPADTTASIEKALTPEAAKRKAEANVCQEMLQTVTRTGTIQFERGSAQLDPASAPTLERLADVAGKCAQVRFEVAGHTDSDGTPYHNQRLSEKRAQSVVDFLAEAGVPTGRMHAVGYGRTRPLAPNTTDANKATNRRIEFVVKTD